MSDGAEAILVKPHTLVVGILTIQSSPAQEIERPGEVPDTVQFWIGPTTRWKIRTYAIDHDVHSWHLGGFETVARDKMVQFAVDHIGKHYSDILARYVIIELPDTSDTTAIQDALSEHRLTGGLQEAEWEDIRFAFWTPDGAQYLSQTGEGV